MHPVSAKAAHRIRLSITGHRAAGLAPEIVGVNVVIIGNHHRRPIFDQIAKANSQIPELPEVIPDRSRYVLIRPSEDDSVSPIGLVDLIARKEDEIRVLLNEIGYKKAVGEDL